MVKRGTNGLQRLTVPEIKQIGGRAGRYRPANTKISGEKETEPNVGLITCLEEIDLPFIQQALKIEPPPLTAAGIIPPDTVIRKVAAYFPPSVPFEYLYKRTLALAKLSPLFFMCDPKSQLHNAEIIDSVQGLPTEDQLKFMASPMDARSPNARDVTCAFVNCVAEHDAGRLLDIPYLNLNILEKRVSANKDYMHDLESLHKAVILYQWLSFRFGGIFTDRTLASHVKELVEERMVRALTEFSAHKTLRRNSSLKRQIALEKQMLEAKRMGVASDDWSFQGEQEQQGVDLPNWETTQGESLRSADSFSDSENPLSETDTSWTEGDESSGSETSWYDSEVDKRE